MKLLLEKCYENEFNEVEKEKYVFDHENGQKDTLSPYRILVNSLNKEKHEFSDLFYNNLDIPDLWCVFPQELDGQILCRGKKKADIFFKSPNIMRNVHRVAWIEDGFNYKTDYYDVYGLKFFTEYYDEKLGLLLTTFYTDDNKEVLSIHHKNEVFIVSNQDSCKVYYSYKEFVDYIERIGGLR